MTIETKILATEHLFCNSFTG